jgi:sarcosine oxidase subunit beta
VLAELARDGRSSTPIEAFAIERFDPIPEPASTTASDALPH